MSEVSMCEYCGQLEHATFCDESKIALFDEIKAERDESRARHTRYLALIERPLKDVREWRESGEPANGDAVEIERLVADRDRLREGWAELDNAVARDVARYFKADPTNTRFDECRAIFRDSLAVTGQLIRNEPEHTR